MIGQGITELEGLTTPILLDSDLGMATNALGTLNASYLVSGDWPILLPGNNPVSFTGAVSNLTITPRWRWL